MSGLRHDRHMAPIDTATRRALESIAIAVRAGRLRRRWSQRRLAEIARMNQATISRMEQGRGRHVALATVVRAFTALGVEVELRFIGPVAVGPSQVRDRRHARAVAYVVRRLARHGFELATEVEVGDGRWLGFIDILAFHPIHRWMLVVEVKSAIVDIGGSERQLAAYERDAWTAAHSRGWRPRAATAVLVVERSDATIATLRESREAFDRAFPLRASEIRRALDRPDQPPSRGRRGLALVDPASRRRTWLLSTPIDGRSRVVDRPAAA